MQYVHHVVVVVDDNRMLDLVHALKLVKLQSEDNFRPFWEIGLSAVSHGGGAGKGLTIEQEENIIFGSNSISPFTQNRLRLVGAISCWTLVVLANEAMSRNSQKRYCS